MSDEFDAYDLSEFTEQDLADMDNLARAHGAPDIQIAIEHSPFNKFLSWKNHLAVTDLVSPLWCEVQYEYSLYGRRNKPLHLRPSTFISKSGKRIRVDQQVARTNDRRLKRGKSVHKALENELRPVELVVNVVSEEERFGLRLLGLIDGLNQLASDGIARELPVFVITHDKVVLGVIDEVLRVPLTQQGQDRVVSPSSVSPPKKKQRLISSSTQQEIYSPADPQTAVDHGRGTEPTDTRDLYELRIVDYKTRRSSNIPLDEDSLSPRLQLMLYHRMLSALLNPDAFDFGLLWSRLNLSPTKPFSTQFLKDILWEQRKLDPSDCDVNLNCLVSLWCSTVQRKCTGLIGVSQQLQIIYRRSVYAGKQREELYKATETVGVDDPLEALTFQDELDLARAIEVSLSEFGDQEAHQVARLVAHNVKQVGPTSIGRTSAVWKDLISPSDSGQSDPALAWAIQQSLLTCARELQQADTTHDGPPLKSIDGSSKEQVQEVTTADISPIIGMKEVRMNDGELDAHLADVLGWWFGTRPARGVDVGQTNRCFTCEYQDSCEWREQKAREAAALASERKIIMDGWVDYLHVEFLGEHVLFRFLRLRSLWSFALASIVITIVCLCERLLTVVLNKNIQPSGARHSRIATAAWRSSVYGSVTFLRLLYMLIAMSNQLGAIVTVVMALSIGQFAIEYVDYQELNLEEQVEEPLLETSFGRRPTKRLRSKSKPDGIFIHPNESNLARADAFALELGIGGDTELVQGNRAHGQPWQLGRGRDVARETFGGSHRHLDFNTSAFNVGDDDDA